MLDQTFDKNASRSDNAAFYICHYEILWSPLILARKNIVMESYSEMFYFPTLGCIHQHVVY